MLNTALKKLKTSAIIAVVILLLIALRMLDYYGGFYQLSNLNYDMSGGVVLAIVCIALAIVLAFFSLLVDVIMKNNV